MIWILAIYILTGIIFSIMLRTGITGTIWQKLKYHTLAIIIWPAAIIEILNYKNNSSGIRQQLPKLTSFCL